jgi:septation ring formation regulator EzrA
MLVLVIVMMSLVAIVLLVLAVGIDIRARRRGRLSNVDERKIRDAQDRKIYPGGDSGQGGVSL